MKSRPFGYNPSKTQISGTTQVGDIVIGDTAQDYGASPGGIQWFNGADEDLGYIICETVPTGDFPTPSGNIGTLKFWRSSDLTTDTFLELTNNIYNQHFSTGQTAKDWLHSNNYWTSWTEPITTTTTTTYVSSTPTSFTGLGSGIESDPFQITNVSEFNQMNGWYDGYPIFTGTGLNDIYIDGQYNHNTGETYTIKIASTGYVISGNINYYTGSGYQVGDIFSVDGGNPTDLTTFTIWNVGSNGELTGADITHNGTGYSSGTGKSTTAITGVGVGATVSLSVGADKFTWKIDSGTESSHITIDNSYQYIGNHGITVKFNNTTGHTVNDYWSIVCNPTAYFKLQNDIDFSGLTSNVSSMQIKNFYSHLDGNNKDILNLTVGYAYYWGFELKNGCSIKNTTFRLSRSVNNNEYMNERLIFVSDYTSLSNVSLTGIHIITSNSGQLLWLNTNSWNSNCILNDIVLEGDIQGVFQGTIYGSIENLKVLRTSSPFSAYSANPYLVSSLYGEMKYCQNIILNYILNRDDRFSLLVQSLETSGKITESFAMANIDIEYADTSTQVVSHGLVSYCGAYPGNTVEIKDSYIKGKFTVNGGENTNMTESNNGKSGFMVSANANILINRCIANVDIITPLNNNRAVFTKESSTKINNCFYNTSALTTLTPVDVENRQNGLTSNEFIDSSNFTTFDFDTIWTMGNDGPELINNPIYTYETPASAVQVLSATRSSETSFDVVINPIFTSNYGIDIYTGNTLILTVENTLSPTINVDRKDLLYTIIPFYMNGVTKVQQSLFNYQHYILIEATIAPIEIVRNTSTLKVIRDGEDLDANSVHGSLIYNNYIYGVTRNDMPCFNDAGVFGFNKNQGCLVKAPENDISSFQLIPIQASDKPESEYNRGEFSRSMESLVECGGYLYFTFYVNYPTPSSYLGQFDTSSENSYKVFRIGNSAQTFISNGVIASDGKYLYINDVTENYKIDANQFVGDYPKYNVDTIFNVSATTYNCDSQGDYILGGYDPRLKGTVHSTCCDAEYLYISFTTSNGTDSGYYEPLNISCHEVHKIRKSDMTPAGWCKIPKSTDDMAQNDTHLFYGIEVQSNADTRCYGYGWGAYAVRKSDMHITGLPRLHSLDNSPAVQSYGSFLFGNYIIDIKTNKLIYVLDISDVDNWSIDEPIANRTLAVFKCTDLSTVTNEILLNSGNTFYGFNWSSIADICEFQLSGVSGITYYAEPIVDTISVTLSGSDYILSGYLLNTGGLPITSKGFHYGTSIDNLSTTITIDTLSPDLFFNYTLSGLGSEIYYQAFAINSIGESSALIKSTSISITTTTTLTPTTTSTTTSISTSTTTTTTLSTTTTTTTTSAPGLVVNYASAGDNFNIALKSDGQVWGWGYNSLGRLGDNTVVSKSTPVSILGAKKTFCQISTRSFTLGIDKYGQVWGWGANDYGRLGNSGTNQCTPVSISGAKKTFCNISTGNYHAMGIDKYGQIWGWGYNSSGQLGNNSTVQKMTPVSILGAKKTFCTIDMGNSYSVGIDNTGQVWGWGYNYNGELGDNSKAQKLTPVSIMGTKKTFCAIGIGNYHSIGLDKNGQVWGWGNNGYGRLGNNSDSNQCTPVSILGVKKTFCAIAGGSHHTMGIDKNGQVWGWGFNGQGQLGNNSTAQKMTPVSILGTKKTFCKIYSGAYLSLAIDNYGQLWSWGTNNYGQLGNNTTTSERTPIKVCNI